MFSSVAIPAEEADEYVDRVIRDFRVQGGELKGKNLPKTAAGRKAVSKILSDCLQRSDTVVIDKTLALCGKLFEYIFEPVIADISSLFYNIGFNKYVANLLYFELIATGQSLANDLLLDFEKMMRQTDVVGLKKLFGVPPVPANNELISAQVLTFALAHHDVILAELAPLIVTVKASSPIHQLVVTLYVVIPGKAVQGKA